MKYTIFIRFSVRYGHRASSLQNSVGRVSDHSHQLKHLALSATNIRKCTLLQRHLLSSSRGKDGNLWSLQDLQDASPSSLFAPALIATDHGLPGPEALGK